MRVCQFRHDGKWTSFAATRKPPHPEDLHSYSTDASQRVKPSTAASAIFSAEAIAIRSPFMFQRLALLSFVFCAVISPAARAQQSEAETAIRKADADWAKTAQTKKVDAWIAYYSDDATILPPNEKPASSPTDIRKSITDMLGLPGLSITWEPNKVEAASSGDLGYSYGTYQLIFSGPGGKPVKDRGKYLEVWKKQKDGRWKCAADMWSSDLPAAPAN
jgi:ketosteroid isomerase-like protein